MKTFTTSVVTFICLGILIPNAMPQPSDIPRAPTSGIFTISQCEDQEYVYLNGLQSKAKNQETGEWCWAAVQQMVMWYHGDDYYNEQCAIATALLFNTGSLPGSIRSCCDPISIYTPDCATTGWPNFSLYGFNVTQVDVSDPANPLGSPGLDGWGVLKSQICKKRPFIITLGPSTGETPHQYVISGYKDKVTTITYSGKPVRLRLVYDIDPAGPELEVRTYDSYRYDFDGTGIQSIDYIDIFPQ